MFRDSRGVVHTVSSADPLLDLPGDTAAALAQALLRPQERDLQTALERCEAVRELVERWQDAFFAGLDDSVDLAEEARWAAEAGVSLAEVEAAYDDGDEPDDDPDEDEDEDVLTVGDVVADPAPDPVDLVDLVDLPAQDELAALLPEDLVAVLERELLLLPLRVRLEALVAAAALVGTWADLLGDHEKLLGHLVLAHGASPADVVEPGEGAHPQLAARHAALHAHAGPGHPCAPST